MKHKWKQPKLKKIRGIKCWESKWLWRVWHNKKNFVLHSGIDIGTDTEFFCHEPIVIFENVKIGAKCLFYTYDSERNVRKNITIWKNVCIGAGCIIFPNVIIHSNEKIPAGSIVYINKKGERIIK